MMTRWSIATPLVLIAATGCLATKSDIVLLQAEARTTRSQVSQGDTAILRADAERRAQIDRLLADIVRANDSLRVLSMRLAAFQATVNGQLSSMGEQLVTVQERLGQTTANSQELRRQLEALKEQGTAAITSPAAAPPSAPGDTTRRPPAGVPGRATLYNSAYEQLKKGSFHTARTGFELLLNTYPDYDGASSAMLHIGDAYRGEGNTAAADSVYQLVVAKFPKSPDAPPAMYRRGRLLWDNDKKADARVIFNRLIADYPRSDEADLAKSLLRP
jgi:tol-pal system protein YbgF